MASRASPLFDSPAPLTRGWRPAASRPLRVQAGSWTDSDDPSFRLQWDALAERAAEPNPFLESWSLLPALRTIDPHGSVVLLRFVDDHGLAGVLPIGRSPRYYRRPLPMIHGWAHPNAFLGTPLVATGCEHAFWTALLSWADDHAGIGLFLHLTDITLEGPLYAALAEVLAEQARLHGIVHRTERALLASGETPDAYLAASLSGKKRKELRRQFARLSEQGKAEFEWAHGTGNLADWTNEFLALEAMGWKGQAGSALASSPTTEAIFRETLEGAGARDKLVRLALRLDGKPIAMLASFLTPPGAFSYKTAFDESFSRFSPGVLLQCENLLMLDRLDIAWTDSCAAAEHPMIDHIWRERRSVGRLSIAIGGLARRAVFAQLLKRELAHQVPS